MTFLGSALFGGPLKTALVAWNVVVDLLEATLDSPPKVANEKRSATFPDIGEEQWDSEDIDDNHDSDTAKEGFASHLDGADAEGGGRQGGKRGLNAHATASTKSDSS